MGVVEMPAEVKKSLKEEVCAVAIFVEISSC